MSCTAGPYSHPPEDGQPGVPLIEHLHDVRDRVGMIVPSDATTPAGESLVAVVEKLALVHDFGKATKWFQQYIDDQSRDPTPPQKRYHAPLGAFAAYYVLRESGFVTETCLAGFVAVAKHHGRLPNVAEYVEDRSTEKGTSDERLDAIAHQTANIHEDEYSFAERIFQEATGDDDAWQSFAVELVDDGSLFAEIADHVTVGELASPETFSTELYGLVLEAWGSLVLADKTSVAGAPAREAVYKAEQPSLDPLEKHVAELEADVNADPDGSRTERLNHFRSRARDDVLDNVPKFVDADSDVATITLPTGMGKTLTGLSAALAVRNQTGGDRVVYALPFTSIIDQVAAEVKDIFPTDGTDDLLVTHHHLADTHITPREEGGDDEEADLNDDVAGMLGESWRAGLTVSTFVQLFESLAGPRNTQSMKVPALRNSVVVLDEPQSLPLDWWKLVPRLVDVLTEQYDATVIAMTATQPELFDDRFQLVSDVDDYFQAAERVRYRLDDSVGRYLDGTDDPLEYEPAADELVSTARDGTAVLSVCNTIDSARRLTDAVTERIDEIDVASVYFDELRAGVDNPVEQTVGAVQSLEGIPFVHLSTRLRPTDRLALIQLTKALREQSLQVVAVTTQLVEAGVDVSFEALYRDLAPVDSIVQAAGRCNRSFERQHGDVTVWWLAQPDEQRNTPAVAVYDTSGPALLPVTAAALETARDGSSDELGELDVARTAVKDYYRRLHDDKRVGASTYADYVDDANAADLGALSLIGSRLSVDVLVCLTDADERLVDELQAAYEAYDFDRVSELENATRPLRISVPIYDRDSPEADAVTSLPPLVSRADDSDVRVLRPQSSQYEKYFEETTGFVVPDAGVERRFL